MVDDVKDAIRGSELTLRTARTLLLFVPSGDFIQEWRESVTIEIKQGEKVVHQLSLDEASVCKNPCRAIDWVMREFCKSAQTVKCILPCPTQCRP